MYFLKLIENILNLLRFLKQIKSFDIHKAACHGSSIQKETHPFSCASEVRGCNLLVISLSSLVNPPNPSPEPHISLNLSLGKEVPCMYFVKSSVIRLHGFRTESPQGI